MGLLRDNPAVPGIEVLNRNDRYPWDVALWDALLEEAMPARPVWGFANDDMHESDQIGYSWETFLLDELNEATFRQAVTEGRFYLSARGCVESKNLYPPIIQSIRHDPATRTVVIAAASDGEQLKSENCRWIADGKTVHEGLVLNYGQVRGLGRYVRAELTGKGGTTYTNPFGFSREAP